MKKAILVVSFGTSHLDALKNSIEKIENKTKVIKRNSVSKKKIPTCSVFNTNGKRKIFIIR